MVCWGFPQPSAISRQHYPGLLLPGSTSRQPLCQAWGLQSISQLRPSEVRLHLSRQPQARGCRDTGATASGPTLIPDTSCREP